MAQQLVYKVRDLSGGAQMKVGDFLVGRDEFRRLVNFNLDTIGEITKVTGYSLRGNEVDGLSSILGASAFYYPGNQKQIMVGDNGVSSEGYIFDPSTDTWTAQSLSLTSGAKAEFCSYLGGLFMVNYSDATRFYDGTTWSIETNVTSAPKARYITAMLDRVYLLNLEDNGSKVQASSLAAEDYTITWDTGATGPNFLVSPKDGEDIMGGGVNSYRLLIFKESTLWLYDLTNLIRVPGAPGTNSHRSIVNVGKHTLYFHKTGVYDLVGNDSVLVSRSVQEIIDGVQAGQLGDICAYNKGDHYVCYLGDIYNADTNLAIERCVIDYDVALRKWRIGSLAHSPLVFNTYRDDRSDLTYDEADYEYDYVDKNYDSLVSASDNVFFGDNSGVVYTLDNSQTYSGTTINAFFETPNYFPTGGTTEAIYRQVYVYTNSRRLRLYYSIDDLVWLPLNKYEHKNGYIIYHFPPQTISNRIRFKGVDSSSGKKVAIKGWDIVYSPQPLN